jgi:hypothetical protein
MRGFLKGQSSGLFRSFAMVRPSRSTTVRLCFGSSAAGIVVLRPPNVTQSYSIMPITCIVNGAIITRSENKLWYYCRRGKRLRMNCQTCHST